MALAESVARQILKATHYAWTERDIDRTLGQYCDDLTYVCNTGGVDGGPLTVTGKEQFRDFLSPVLNALKSISTVSDFSLDGERGRALIRCTLLHRKTGLALTGTYTQLITYREKKIARLEEIHDACRMEAFWQLVLSEEEEPSLTIVKKSDTGDDVDRWRKQLPSAFPGRSTKPI